jgi:hypothetical protein
MFKRGQVLKTWILLIAILIWTPMAWAYPEFVRHGYVNCTSCHIAPTGGGTLNAYGRQLSRAALSTWGYDGEEKPAYFINQPEWLNLGGDYRSAYVYQNTPLVESGTYQFMQLDVEAAAQYKSWTFDASIGYQDPDNPQYWTDHLISRRHYLMYHLTDEIALRGGKFFPEYGIFTPNHSLVIKDQLDIYMPMPLGDGESYNLEFSYIGDPFNVVVTGIFGRPDDPPTQRDMGTSVWGAYNVTDHDKIGLSYLYGTNDNRQRHVFGPYGLLGITKQLYVMTEGDFQALTPKSTVPNVSNPTQWGFVETTRVGYELVQGLHFIVDQEFARPNFSSVQTLKQRYGAGVWWFPRPHLEAGLEYQKRQDRAQPFTDYYDYLYFLWHIYI